LPTKGDSGVAPGTARATRNRTSSTVAAVTHVIDSLAGSGGAEQQLVANLKHFSDERLSHTLVCLYDRDGRQDEVPSRVPVHFLYAGEERPGGRLGVIRRLDRLVSSLHPDLIHCSLPRASLAARLVGQLRGVLVIESLVNVSHETLRTTDNPKAAPWKLAAYRLVDRLTMRNVARFHALSEAVAASWSRSVGIPRAKITTIPRGVDLTEFDVRISRAEIRRELVRELRLDPNPFVILNVGRQVAQKGQRFLVDAMPHILKALPEAVLVLVGSTGGMTPVLEESVDELGLTKRVRFLGVRRDIPRLLKAADVFVFPSLFEGFGVSLLQAMAMGLPCVTADAPPMNELITHGKTGLLVQARSSASIANAVIRLERDPMLAGELGRRARVHATAQFGSDEAARRLEALYAEVLGLRS
jgi:glycosyltransferase involved in cell wall biosynthesis